MNKKNKIKIKKPKSKLRLHSQNQLWIKFDNQSRKFRGWTPIYGPSRADITVSHDDPFIENLGLSEELEKKGMLTQSITIWPWIFKGIKRIDVI